MPSTQFYSRLPLLTDFRAISRAENFAPLPEDWHVVMSDVRNSTVAVQSGQYKNVNTVGAALITALLNAAGAIEIPFIFEGDGPQSLTLLKPVLSGCRLFHCESIKRWVNSEPG